VHVRVLGIDPGLTRCGIAVVDVHSGRRVSLVYAGVVRTSKDADLGVRLQQLELGILEVVTGFEPTAIAVEQVFSQHNVRTVIGTAQAAGIASLVAARQGIPMAFHTPSEVKAAVTGSGRADKQQVALMVGRIVGKRTMGLLTSRCRCPRNLSWMAVPLPSSGWSGHSRSAAKRQGPADDCVAERDDHPQRH
jgi:crossover junction endodeoxyribonuclease RuvC